MPQYRENKVGFFGKKKFKLHKNSLCNKQALSYVFKYCTAKKTRLDTKPVQMQKREKNAHVNN